MVDFAQRPWLVALPDEKVVDLFERIESDIAAGNSVGAQLSQLASYRLKTREYERIGQIVKRLLAEKPALLAPLEKFRLGVVSNASVELLAPLIAGASARLRLAVEVVFAPFGQGFSVASKENPFFERSFDAVLYAPFWQAFQSRAIFSNVQADQHVEDLCVQLRNEVHAIAERAKSPVFVQNVAAPARRAFGAPDATLPFGSERVLGRINECLHELGSESGNSVLDFNGLASDIGRLRFFDSRNWHWTKLPIANDWVVNYADLIARSLGAMRGKSARALILDLDNTLWGGVIGDAGMSGIVLGQGSTAGEAFLATQQACSDFRQRGVVLAVSSKNEETTAREVFRDHPEMILKEKDIVAFAVNWKDKASNIRELARVLDLGLDAFVFLDDNPVERAQVREALPGVAVPELPNNPSYYADVLYAGGYFEALGFTEEDMSRASQYAANAERQKMRVEGGNIGQFLESLSMESEVGRFTPLHRKRITQLIGKSNQFNLTTRRYSETEVAALETDPSCEPIFFRLSDRFGDNGLIAVIICRDIVIDGEAGWEIDSWLMSCRVLGRKMEEASLNECVRRGRAEGKKFLIGRYIPTSRNGIVADHYGKLGFVGPVEKEAGEQEWRLDFVDFRPFDVPIAFKSKEEFFKPKEKSLTEKA